MKTTVLSIVYAGVESYLSSFFASLDAQTDKNFDVFLINDGLADLPKYLKSYDLAVQVQNCAGTPATLRKNAIERVVGKGADAIIFADADDYFAENRIELSKKLIARHDIVFNELVLFQQAGSRYRPLLENYYTEGQRITLKDIMHSNCLGFTNTTIKTKSLPQLFLEIPPAIIAYDWAFFALCLHAGHEAVFTKKTKSYYRQYANNIASPYFFSEAQILRGVTVKRDHYGLLSQFYPQYVSLAKEFNALWQQLTSDPALKDKYIKTIRGKCPSLPLWWEPIKTFEELGI